MLSLTRFVNIPARWLPRRGRNFSRHNTPEHPHLHHSSTTPPPPPTQKPTDDFFSKNSPFMLIGLLLLGGSIGYSAPGVIEKYEQATNRDKKIETFSLSDDLDKLVPQGMVTEKVFFDIEVGGKNIPRIIIGLYGQDCPITVNNFKSLCTGFTRKVDNNVKTLSYTNCKFHRIIPGFVIQGLSLSLNCNILNGR